MAGDDRQAPPRRVALGTVLKQIRRLVTKPDRVYVVYDKERTQINPRPPGHVYAPVEAVLGANREAFSDLLEELSPLLRAPALAAVPDAAAGGDEPYWNNGFFSFIDARAAYALTAARRPARIVEIGSGNSTRFFRKAIRDHDIPCLLTSIDPAPRAEVAGIADEVLRLNLLDVDLGLFRGLGEGDFLFFDGSHLVFNGTDTTRFFLEILPALAPGVLVHVHDICLPFEYGTLFTERMYAEQYLLGCVLLDTAKWRPLLPVYYLAAEGRFADLPTGDAGNTSFWMVRL